MLSSLNPPKKPTPVLNREALHAWTPPLTSYLTPNTGTISLRYPPLLLLELEALAYYTPLLPIPHAPF